MFPVSAVLNSFSSASSAVRALVALESAVSGCLVLAPRLLIGLISTFSSASSASSAVRALVVAALLAPSVANALPTYDEVRNNWVSTEGVLLDRNGEVIHELRVDMSGRRLGWVALDEVSPAFIETVIRAEDKRFYKHSGVDWLALGDAALENLFSSQPRGASTISLQVPADLDAALRPSGQKRTVSQKWEQIKA